MIRRFALLSMVGVPVLFALSLMLTVAQEPASTEMPKDVISLIDDVRGATAEYRDLDTAIDAGYGKFLDCFQNGTDLGMGQHYVNGDLVSDDVVDALHPEALVYEPREDGDPILVAMEYLVFEDQWKGDEPPTLYGQTFNLKTNIPETPPVWALHIWLFTHNPEGLFADFNPLVSCPQDEPIVDMSMPMS